VVQEPEVVLARPRRRWLHRLLIGLNVFVAVCLVATASAYGYYKYRFGQIKKTNLCQVLQSCGDDKSNQPMNVLLVGSDSRRNVAAAERRQFGAPGGERSDTIMILRVEPGQQKAAILSIPRDTWVPIAGTDHSGKINAAFLNGPSQLIATIRSALGIDIDHYAEVDFNGFRGIVNAIGGVTIYFPAPARDFKTGLNVTRAGCVALDGNDALKYVRSRYFEQYESGRWRTDPSADIGRIQRQQDFIRRVLRKAVSRAKNPLVVNSLIGQGVKNLTVDSALSSKDMVRLAKRFRSLEPDAVDMRVLPTANAFIAGQSALKLKQPETQQLIDEFLNRVPPAPTPGALPRVTPNTVRVRVLNGTGSSGQASEAAAGLTKTDFLVAGTGDADSFRYSKSVIRYGQGQLSKAQLLQPYIEGGAQLREDLTLKGVDLVLVTGSDFAGVRGAPAATTTTVKGAPTTAAPATTTTTPGAKPANRGAPAQASC
jgi:LCP family protein required for cell wall assembly